LRAGWVGRRWVGDSPWLRWVVVCVPVMFMSVLASFSTDGRLVAILSGLARAVAARIAGGMMQAAMILLVWQRVRRVEERILGLLRRFRAGALRGVVAAQGRAAGHASGHASGRCGRMPGGLPRGFGWLLPLVPQEAAGFASQLRVVLAEAEMVALLQASPQARRELRPLCRMLGIALDAPCAETSRSPAAAERLRVPFAHEAELFPSGVPGRRFGHTPRLE